MDPIISEPTPETKPEEKQTIPKEQPKKEKNISMSQQIRDLINSKLDSGYQLTDKHSKVELNKIIQDELHISKGNHSDINRAIKEISIKRNIQISDLGFKNDKIGDMSVNLIKNEPETITAPPQQTSKGLSAMSTTTQPQNNLRGALPKTTTEQEEIQNSESEIEPEKKYMSESAQKKLISNGLTKLVFPLYTALGIVELDESEIEEEAKLPKGKQMKKDFEDLANDIDEYLTENNIRLPALLNHLSIIISIFMVLVLPVIKFKFFSSKQDAKPDYDSSAEEIQVKT